MRQILLLLMLVCGVGSLEAAQLPPKVAQAFDQAKIPLSAVSVVVQQVGVSQPIVQINSDKPRSPASTMKLVTTLASLDVLGPAYTWKTEAYMQGKFADGVLHGDLLIKGYGDPKLTIERLWLWLKEWRGRGLREIKGDVILDRSYFEALPHDPGQFDNAPERPYNVGPNPLLLNFNALRFVATSSGLYMEPQLHGYTLIDQLRRPKTRCGADASMSARLEGKKVIVEGLLQTGCPEREDYLSILAADDYFAAVFGQLWQEVGGVWQGKLRQGQVSDAAALFSTHRSQSLGEVVRDTNKYSNNVLARHLLLALGATKSQPASVANGNAVIGDWLKANQLTFPELVIENGSGLSRREQISAQHMAQLLNLAGKKSIYAEYVASLPLLANDGTLRTRLRNSEAAGHAHMKTGLLDESKTLAGYVHAKSGRQWVVVVFVNHANAKKSQPAQDALVEWVWLQ